MCFWLISFIDINLQSNQTDYYCLICLWFGLIWIGLVWVGLVWFGIVWYGGLDWIGLVTTHFFDSNKEVVEYIVSQCQTTEELKKTLQPSMGDRWMGLFLLFTKHGTLTFICNNLFRKYQKKTDMTFSFSWALKKNQFLWPMKKKFMDHFFYLVS